MAEQILETMQNSGLHDRVGGGFHRYTTDRAWRIPHFEKMLYDNAQLMALYARASIIFDRSDFLQTSTDIGDYLIRNILLDIRSKRPRPGRDYKVLTDLNGLVLEGFSF